MLKPRPTGRDFNDLPLDAVTDTICRDLADIKRRAAARGEGRPDTPSPSPPRSGGSSDTTDSAAAGSRLKGQRSYVRG